MLAPTPHEIKSQAYALHYGSARTPIALVVPDSVYPGMYRIRWPLGELSDMVNLSRARDAALAIAERSVPSGNRRHFRWREQGKPANTVFPRLNGGQAATLAVGVCT